MQWLLTALAWAAAIVVLMYVFPAGYAPLIGLAGTVAAALTIRSARTSAHG